MAAAPACPPGTGCAASSGEATHLTDAERRAHRRTRYAPALEWANLRAHAAVVHVAPGPERYTAFLKSIPRELVATAGRSPLERAALLLVQTEVLVRCLPIPKDNVAPPVVVDRELAFATIDAIFLALGRLGHDLDVAETELFETAEKLHDAYLARPNGHPHELMYSRLESCLRDSTALACAFHITTIVLSAFTNRILRHGWAGVRGAEHEGASDAMRKRLAFAHCAIFTLNPGRVRHCDDTLMWADVRWVGPRIRAIAHGLVRS
jgi:hypothetical protein